MDIFCRLCGQIRILKEIKCTINDKTKNIEQKLIDCCRWSQYQNDEHLPHNICNSCFECLEECWQFCEKLVATQIHLKDNFSDWKPNSQQPMNPNFPSVKIELVNFKDEFLDDDQSIEELPTNTWSEDETSRIR